jgi:SHS2 domain-containing protein
MSHAPPAPFEAVEHSGDLFIVARGADYLEALANASSGLVSQIVEADGIAEREERPVVVEGDDDEGRAVAFLNEILYVVYARHWLPRRVKTLAQCHRTGCRELSGTLVGEPYDPGRHELKYDVKAVTYHGFRIENKGDLTEIRFLCDL